MKQIISRERFLKQANYSGNITIVEEGDTLTVVENVLNNKKICIGYEVLNERTNDKFIMSISEYGRLTL